ncbi:undecaprenyldiphospho-muramoylpentapeptide beta-N-acetylglucosaminyltransferase [Porphyromonas circumdentaria]|uniref:UDP-N-acetylglucosamine--N-acetylmuramyl-(pentapeptide) pyrophosphoryl-undecaprenol N-acetylglucosamine transferase n=1 Tax=Porphyromonas circumdentaria TaxID=29524 RepID=A0A1T4L2G6_9PORP|nr:undecaprenyldiphospho-muramoylpentapeptide beta-N-acetylglucosaminyltransferase [Porphyromonas circumdentaria]MBB6275198.1 UDP-N-acetylglucosamine--N-acetylmuramyl-(pentapeptide) pyrophosphoryl-undecaprenol N-acetylglucosamine transferase [Porphyromonas circumdentaria]SJZ48895.1 UDP-N-acetylglucosamine-N-acetylmuramylpentapeptide N-acetylglucosamine transferase [Porphyromonas circumdentaria]
MEQEIERVIISGGGTGGHIFPAIAIADALKQKYPQIEILFIGAEGRMEMERVPQAGYRIEGLKVQGLNRKQLWRNISVLFNLYRARARARQIIRKFRPDAVIGVGGYASAPTLLSAQKLGIPTLIQEQNSFAGKTNKLLARKAKAICVAYPNMERFFPYTLPVITGNPIRPILEEAPLPARSEALRHFGFDDDKSPLVLVVGGSLGARTINESIRNGLELFLKKGVRLIWQTGKGYADEAQKAVQKLGKEAEGKIIFLPFIERMDMAYAASDLMISRAGASTISEISLLGKPSILVPSPNVAEDHQTHNAKALSSRGAALLIPDNEASEELVKQTLNWVTQPEKLQSMSKAVLRLASPQSAKKIVSILEQIIFSPKV